MLELGLDACTVEAGSGATSVALMPFCLQVPTAGRIAVTDGCHVALLVWGLADGRGPGSTLACQTQHFICFPVQSWRVAPSGMLVLPSAHLAPGKDGSGATICSWEEKKPWLCASDFWPTYRLHEWVRQKAACSGLHGPQGRMSTRRSSAPSLHLAPSTSISGGSRSSSLLSLGWSSQHGPLSWVNTSQAGWSMSQEEKARQSLPGSFQPCGELHVSSALVRPPGWCEELLQPL